MQSPLISILTPFKNTAKYLNDCLNSIINQTHTNWELLIVDDTSTDNSYNIVLEFSKKDTRIKLFKNNGSGIIDALKTAYNNSNGEFITRMDSDDIMPTNKLEIMAKSLIEKGKGHVALGLVIVGNVLGVDIWAQGIINKESFSKHGIHSVFGGSALRHDSLAQREQCFDGFSVNTFGHHL